MCVCPEDDCLWWPNRGCYRRDRRADSIQKTVGDWTPKGRLTEDGSLPEQYHLQETPTAHNVIDSDGTVVFTHGTLSGGSLLTRKKAVQHGKPVLHVDLAELTNEDEMHAVVDFFEQNDIEGLNLGGSRGSKDLAFYDKV